ncbi:MAG TPA: amidohydrolase [Vicinamibacteria bacterium]|nr:amidohydrolase [Vicinamibacteria bacterium]
MQRRAFALGLLVSVACGGSPNPADLVVQAGRIYDFSGDALAVRDGVVVETGSFDNLKAHVGPETQVLRFSPDALILPGFEDSHIHLLSGGLSLFEVDLFDADSLSEIQERVRAFVAANVDDPWILGRGWKYTAMPDGRLPTRDDLDAAVADRPAFLLAYDGHSGWANSQALELAGIESDTRLEGFGEIVRDADGRPTGALKESAMQLVRRLIPSPSRARKLEALQQAMERLASHGTVAIQNASGDEEELGLYRELLELNQLKLRVAMAMSIGAETTSEEIARIAALARSNPSPWLKVVGVKIVLDGVIESHTASLLEPYADAGSRGEPVTTQEALDSLVDMAHAAGLQVWIHAIGDRAVRMALDAYERTGATDARFRIEHIELVHPDDIPRFRKLGVLAAMQPIHAYPSTVAVWSKAVGAERLPYAFAWQSLASSGAELVFGTDWPASISVAPLRGIHNAVNRRTLEGDPPEGFVPAERVSLDTAIAAFTFAGAFAAFDEERRGGMRPGQLADFVVLSEDLYALEPMEIARVRPLLTVVGGNVTYREGS